MIKIVIEITSDSGMVFIRRKVTSLTHDCAILTRLTSDREDPEVKSTNENAR